MRERILILLLGDIILSTLSVYAGFTLRFWGLPKIEGMLFSESSRMLLFTFVAVFSTFLVELYNSDLFNGKKMTLIRIFVALVVSFFILSSLYYMFPSFLLGRGVLLLSIGVFGPFQYLWHTNCDNCLNLPGIAKRVLILGTGPLAEKIGMLINSANSYYVLAGYVNCATEPVHVPVSSVIGNATALLETARNANAHQIIVSLSEQRGIIPVSDVLNCKMNGIEVTDAPSFYEHMTGKLLIENMKPSWLIYSDGFKITEIKRFFKRFCDIMFAAVGLIIAFPLIVFVSLFIRLDSRGPIFFRQVRVGQREKNFVLYKFRTMRQDAESKTGAVWAQKNDPRVTRVGGFLRKSRLDEIPQLFNVIKGEMSFIGPRPERPEFVKKLETIIPYYSERHSVKPGVTGWAQVKYPYGASVEDAIEKLRYDLFYIKNLSFIYDMLIVLETIKVVIFGRGGR